MSTRLAIAIGVLIVYAAAIGAAKVIDAGNDESSDQRPAAPQSRESEQTIKQHEGRTDLPPATAGAQPGARSDDPLTPGADASWAEFSASISSEVGLAVMTVGSEGPPRTFGPLQSGHAWSTIKVPILVTLIAEREAEGRSLDGEEMALARAALTASDNAAAAGLFRRLEESEGGLTAASHRVSETIDRAAATHTEVTTAPPPSGAVSTYGQTDWSLSASAEFISALASGCLLGEAGSGEVLSQMSEVVPEQQWGLATANFGPGAGVAYKAGWGPEGSSAGSYLVRQSGTVQDGEGQVAVAMMAIDDSGTFEGGIADLNGIAGWLAENLKTPLPRGGRVC